MAPSKWVFTFLTQNFCLLPEGESDSVAQDLIDSYEENLVRVVHGMRRICGNDSIPFILGELGTFLDKDRFFGASAINNAMSLVANSVENVILVSSVGLRCANMICLVSNLFTFNFLTVTKGTSCTLTPSQHVNLEIDIM